MVALIPVLFSLYLLSNFSVQIILHMQLCQFSIVEPYSHHEDESVSVVWSKLTEL